MSSLTYSDNAAIIQEKVLNFNISVKQLKTELFAKVNKVNSLAIYSNKKYKYYYIKLYIKQYNYLIYTLKKNLRISITKNLDYFKDLSSEQIMNERKNKFLRIGRDKGFTSNSEDLSSLTIKRNNINKILLSKKKLIGTTVLGLILLIMLISLF